MIFISNKTFKDNIACVYGCTIDIFTRYFDKIINSLFSENKDTLQHKRTVNMQY